MFRSGAAVRLLPGSCAVPARFLPGGRFLPGSCPVPARFLPGSCPVPAQRPVPARFLPGSCRCPTAGQDNRLGRTVPAQEPGSNRRTTLLGVLHHPPLAKQCGRFLTKSSPE